MVNKKQALGRGLKALLENTDTDVTTKQSFEGNTKTVGSVSNIALSDIETNPFQPRTEFDYEALQELSSSIKEHGIIQPITVRKLGYDKYQLISGERRFRASKLAGLEKVPAYIRVADDQAMLEMALVENIQRENLDAIEVAMSFQRLMDECQLTQEALSEKVGKNRTTVTNYLRLLKLPAEIQLAIRQGKISMGHARALITMNSEQEQLAVLEQILSENLSVRDVEQAVKKQPSSEKPSSSLSKDEQALAASLKEIFGNKAKINPGKKGGGKMTISYSDLEQLKAIVSKLTQDY